MAFCIGHQVPCRMEALLLHSHAIGLHLFKHEQNARMSRYASLTSSFAEQSFPSISQPVK